MDNTFDLVPCVAWLLFARDISSATRIQITDVAGQPTLRGKHGKQLLWEGSCGGPECRRIM